MIATNIVIYFLNKDDTIADLLRNETIYVSFITELELLGQKNLSAKEEKTIDSFLQDCQIVELDNKIKQQYRLLKKKYNQKLADSIIVSTPIAMDLPLLSADKQLKTIKELDLLIYNI